MPLAIRMRVSSKHVHYADNLVDGAMVLGLFGDALTEESVRLCGDEGLLSRYENVKFHSRVHPGDFIEVHVEKIFESRLKFRCELTAKRVIRGMPHDGATVSFLASPELVATANAEMVMPYAKRRES